MTAPSLLDELASEEKWLRQAAGEIASEGHNGWGNTCSQAADCIKRTHAALAGMAKRLEAAERDAAELRMCKGEYAMPDGTIAKCHVNVGVNVWHGERWLAFHECSPDQLRLIIDDAAQEGKG